MAQDLFHYDKMVEGALRGVVRDALARVAQDGLRGAHHFYIAFATTQPGVIVPEHLRERFPAEMTIVLQHQFWDLRVDDDTFSVTLSFHKQPERLIVPFAAVRSFADPSVDFALEFAAPQGAAEPVAALAAAAPPAPEAAAKSGAEVVTLDKFRKR